MFGSVLVSQVMDECNARRIASWRLSITSRKSIPLSLQGILATVSAGAILELLAFPSEGSEIAASSFTALPAILFAYSYLCLEAFQPLY